MRIKWGKNVKGLSVFKEHPCYKTFRPWADIKPFDVKDKIKHNNSCARANRKRALKIEGPLTYCLNLRVGQPSQSGHIARMPGHEAGILGVLHRSSSSEKLSACISHPGGKRREGRVFRGWAGWPLAEWPGAGFGLWKLRLGLECSSSG